MSAAVFLEVSAKTKENIDNLFIRLASETYNRRNSFTKVDKSPVAAIAAGPNGFGSTAEEKKKCILF